MDISEIVPEIKEMLEKIGKVQGDWNGECSCVECYWNMWHPTMADGRYNNDESKVCISESLTELKMTPNTNLCEGYWSR